MRISVKVRPQFERLLRVKFVCVIPAAFALFLAACTGTGQPVLSSGDRYRADGMITDVYQLGAGDKVHVIVFNEPQLTGDFVVDSAGQLSLPLIGSTDVQGKTVTEVSTLAQNAFRDRHYLINPQVSVEVTTYRPFFIVGEVRMPGQYPYVAGLTVWNAVATAQGLTPRARKKVVYIRRFGEAAELPYTVTPDLRVWPGDTVRFGERYF